MTKAHIWLRAETKPHEQRTALSPQGAKTLVDAGFKVSVECSSQNIFDQALYRQVNAEIVEQGSWINAPKDAIVLGLKELPEDDFPLIHQHIYFAHAYKEQAGWQDLLSRFKRGGGELYDLEYLVDEQQRRVAAFGYWAGFAGAALSVLAWANQQQGMTPPLADIHSYQDKEQLLTVLKQAISQVDTQPQLLVIGAKGRSGSGAVDLAKALSLDVLEWDLAETKKGGPFVEITQADIFVNCVLVNQDLPPFITKELLKQPERKLSVIVDVSCDPYGSYNPLPIYQQCTTFKTPCLRLDESNILDLIAIDHLPSLLPKESSEDYGEQLVKHLLTLDDKSQGVWPAALALFKRKINEI
ncbi:saccharopine dehydrogenase (NAD+, L-lysine-forming) [Colwellia chukchiensis]|uniref:Saccharopine dehydrogenase [NAD(+), L-lysine-forming] n=1 Tax=Colwellia chukchiensis TaxID=641665 RepID=A0A1H7JR40_9GAMM|nr:saccharopine dehydrogenase [Colwellia chukchiensis]SEK76874.1 saccharopine dehydrogenase (NAD+, L-lysine-forming) [Colwellia chukchiensis]